MTTPADRPLLEVRDLHVHFPITAGVLLRRRIGASRAVDGVSLRLGAGRTLGLVGESGSGKSTLGRAIVALDRPTSGSILIDGVDLSALGGRELRWFRRRTQMVFQDPFASLDPRMTVGASVAEPMRVQGLGTPRERRVRTGELLEMVGLHARHAQSYPHELSGGQRQRVGIARAISVHPRLIVADEPVSALDVSIQAQILNLFDDLLLSLNLTTVFIAHQLSVVRHISNRVAIMYLGRIVETGPTERVFESPQHPYTAGLLAAAPRPDPSTRHRKPAIRGDIPSPLRIPSGCRFRTRCAFAEERCALEDPALLPVERDRLVACHVLPFRAEASA